MSKHSAIPSADCRIRNGGLFVSLENYVRIKMLILMAAAGVHLIDYLLQFSKFTLSYTRPVFHVSF